MGWVRVPVQDSEIEYLLNIHNNTVQSYNSISSTTPTPTPFPFTKIRDSGKSDADSIVIIFLGDAFTAAQYGTWPNPAAGTVLHHANNVINTMLDTPPYGLFSHLFSVYVIHSTGNNQTAGINGYLGTVSNTGSFTPSSYDAVLVRNLAKNVVDPADQTMIQIISNAIDGTGMAAMAWHYELAVNIARTSIRRGENPPGGSNIWGNGTAWHGTIIHEFGHSFGNIVDEHDQLIGDPTHEKWTN